MRRVMEAHNYIVNCGVVGGVPVRFFVKATGRDGAAAMGKVMLHVLDLPDWWVEFVQEVIGTVGDIR